MYLTPDTVRSVAFRYSRNRLPGGRYTGQQGRRATESGATEVISTPSDHVEDWPGTRPGASAGCRDMHRNVLPCTLFLRADIL
jgi:hypothetical protein